jgi:exodeoxyribonuclease VII large subunit
MRDRAARLDVLRRQIERIEPRHAIAQGWRRIEDAQRRLETAARGRVRQMEERVARAARRLERVSLAGQLARQRDRAGHLEARLRHILRRRLEGSAERLSAMAAHLQAVSPQAVLTRGYSITTDPQGRVIRSAEQVKRGDVMTTRLAEGTITSTVGKPRQESLF